MRRESAIALTLLGLLLSADPAGAASQAEWDRCNRWDEDTAIWACSQIIARGQESNEDLAVAYNNRGLAYTNKGQYDRAIIDLDRAIALNPNNAIVYNNRGFAYHNKSQ